MLYIFKIANKLYNIIYIELMVCRAIQVVLWCCAEMAIGFKLELSLLVISVESQAIRVYIPELHNTWTGFKKIWFSLSTICVPKLCSRIIKINLSQIQRLVSFLLIVIIHIITCIAFDLLITYIYSYDNKRHGVMGQRMGLNCALLQELLFQILPH